MILSIFKVVEVSDLELGKMVQTIVVRVQGEGRWLVEIVFKMMIFKVLIKEIFLRTIHHYLIIRVELMRVVEHMMIELGQILLLLICD